MSMQIGAMFRALLGDAAPADSRTLELRIGQIVRGVLMQMLDGGEALININGMPIRARLEADLPVGRGTLLQVQPGSNGSVIVLKPLADMTDAVPDETMKDVVKSDRWQEIRKNNDWENYYKDSQESEKFLKDQRKKYKELVKDSGMK